METRLMYLKDAQTYRCDLGYMSYPVSREEAGELLAKWVLDRDCSVTFFENEDTKNWFIRQEG